MKIKLLALALLLCAFLLGACGAPTAGAPQDGTQAPGTDEIVLNWHREGGIAGFCNDLVVYRSGAFEAANCGSGQPEPVGSGQLSSEQMEILEAWMEMLQPFENDHRDPAEADAMTIRLDFNGEGSQEASPEQMQMLELFAQQIFNQAAGENTKNGAGARDGSREPSGAVPEAARQALDAYFEAFNSGSYRDAAALYGGSYELLLGYNPEIPITEREALLQAACRINGFRCELLLRDIVDVEQVDEQTYLFAVTFSSPDGSLFEQGPCCGADPDSAPPVSLFVYTVRNQAGGYRVMELPVYTP